MTFLFFSSSLTFLPLSSLSASPSLMASFFGASPLSLGSSTSFPSMDLAMVSLATVSLATVSLVTASSTTVLLASVESSGAVTDVIGSLRAGASFFDLPSCVSDEEEHLSLFTSASSRVAESAFLASKDKFSMEPSPLMVLELESVLVGLPSLRFFCDVSAATSRSVARVDI